MLFNDIRPLAIFSSFIIFILYSSSAYSDPSGGGAEVVSVAEAVHSAGQVAFLFEAYSKVMDDAEVETDKERRSILLERANTILEKLIQQANNVESEIAILTSKKLDKSYMQKLDRVLTNVRKMKTSAEQRMQAATKTG